MALGIESPQNEGARLRARSGHVSAPETAQPKSPSPRSRWTVGPSIPVVEALSTVEPWSLGCDQSPRAGDTLQRQASPSLLAQPSAEIREIGCANERRCPITCQNAVTASSQGYELTF